MTTDVTTSIRYCDRNELSEIIGIQLISPSDQETSDVEEAETFNINDYIFENDKVKKEFQDSLSSSTVASGSNVDESVKMEVDPSPNVSNASEKKKLKKDADTSIPDIGSPFDAIVEKVGWPPNALLRLLHLITVHDLCIDPGAEDLFYSFLANKVRWIYSDEPIISLAYVHESDAKRFVRSTKVDEEPFYVRPNYDFKPTADQVRAAVKHFYDYDYIRVHAEPFDGTLGGFQFRKPRTQKVTPATAPQLSRSRRTGRPNPLVEALVEEKKNNKR